MAQSTESGAALHRVTRDLPFALVDPAITRDESLPWQVKAIYVNLAGYAGKDREAFPSLNRIARETGMSRSSVIAAIKCAEKAGLVLVRYEFARDGERSDDPSGGEQTSNRYRLRDFGRGYVAGSGPGKRLPYPNEDRGVAAAPRPVEPLHADGSAAVPEQDHRSSTTGSSTHTSPDEDTAVMPPKPKIFRPKRLDQLDSGEAAERCVAYIVRAYDRIGWHVTYDARRDIGRFVKRLLDERGLAHEQMWRKLMSEVAKFGGPEPLYRDLVVYIGRAA